MRQRSRLLCLALLPCLLPGCIAVIGQRYHDRHEGQSESVSHSDSEVEFQFVRVDEMDDDVIFGDSWGDLKLDELEQRIAALEKQIQAGKSAPPHAH